MIAKNKKRVGVKIMNKKKIIKNEKLVYLNNFETIFDAHKIY